MFHFIDPNEPVHPMITATWPVSDPFELALWLGALAAAVCLDPVHLSDDLSELARENLSRWPAHAQA